jgi:probable lipoprotein (TIGR04455 family)
MKRLLPLAMLAMSSSVVRAARVADHWAKEDRAVVRRLAVVVQLPEAQQKAGEVFARVARRYVNQKRDFLVKQEHAQAEAPELPNLCGGEDVIEGVLHLRLTLTPNGDGFEADVVGSLKRCTDGREGWAGEAGGSFPSRDSGLVEVTQVYVQELGADAQPFVSPALNLLRPLLDTLPQPVLTEADIEEKVTLD